MSTAVGVDLVVESPEATLSDPCLQARARYGSNELPHEEGMPHALVLLSCMTVSRSIGNSRSLMMQQQAHAAWCEDAAASEGVSR